MLSQSKIKMNKLKNWKLKIIKFKLKIKNPKKY